MTKPDTARARRIVVISGGLSVPSSTRLLADRLAAATVGHLGAAEVPASVEVVELRQLAHPLADHLLSGFPTGKLAAALDAVAAADAVIAVTPVFTASYSGLMKSFFDVIDPNALRGKPVLVAATAGTARHSLVLDHAMRPLMAYLGAITVPTGVFAATEDWGSSGLAERIDRAATDLAQMVTSRPVNLASPQPAAQAPWGSSDALPAPTDFADMLRAVQLAADPS